MDKVPSSSRNEELVLAKLVLQCKRKKQSNHVMKVNNLKIANINSIYKTYKSKVPTRENNSAQAIVATNLASINDKAKSDNAEEAKCTWEIGKSLGLYARNDDEDINALADMHMEKEDGTK